jgi:hypothetical protein
VDDTRYPTENAEKYIDQEVSATPSAHCDRQEGKPYRKEVEKDGALRTVSKAQLC